MKIFNFKTLEDTKIFRENKGIKNEREFYPVNKNFSCGAKEVSKKVRRNECCKINFFSANRSLWR